MKPILLKMRSFGSFYKETTIDFSELTQAGIYLISGPTGSGKTTIFDAIVFALYGEASGSMREAKSFRSDYAQASDITEVEFEFQSGKDVYKILRRPSCKKEDGKNQSAKVVLTLPNNTVLEREGEVKSTISNLFKIDASEFKQMVMLAQGEFSKLINSSSKDREIILRKIFKTSKYDSFTSKLEQIKNDASDSLKISEAIIQTSLLGIESPIPYDKENIVLLDEYLINLEKYLSDSQAEIKALEDSRNKELKKLDELKEKLALDTSRNNDINSYNNLKMELSNLNEKLSLIKENELQLKTIEKSKELWPLYKDYQDNLSRIKANKEKIESNEKLFKDSSIKLSNLLNSGVNEDESESKIDLFKKEIDKNNKALNTYDALTTLKDEYEKILDSYNIAQKKYEKEETQFKKLEQSYFLGVSDSIRHSLKDGDKCPVCGNTYHKQDIKFGGHISEEAYDTASKKITDLKDKLNTQKEKVLTKRGNFDASLKAFQELQGSSFEDYNSSLVKNTIASDNASLKNLEKNLFDFRTMKLKLEKESSNLEGSLKALRKTLEEQELESVTKEKVYQDKKELLAITEKEMLENYLNDSTKLKNSINTYYNELARVNGLCDEYKAKVLGLVLVNLDSLKEELKRTDEQFKELDQSLNKKKYQNKSNQTQLEKINKEFAKYKALMEKYNASLELFKVASGQNGSRVSFERFVLQSYFEDILTQANYRLMEITNNRYQLVIKKESQDKRQAFGLDMNIFDMETGRERDVKTLSGGEMFKAALSLALGLSDIIESKSGSIELNSLFIDEGFGTLDQDSLRQAIKILMTLQGSGKSIGIISHVSELKDMVDKVVEVSKTSLGSKATIISK